MSDRWSISLALLSLCLNLAGCDSRESGSSAAVEIVYNCAANADEIRALEAEIPAFTARTGVRIVLNPFTGQEKLYAMIAAGQAPDIFYTNTVIRDRFAAEGRLLDLRTVAHEDSFSHRLHPGVIEEGSAADGGWYSLSNWSFTCGVYYDRQAFAAAGLPVPDSAWTWEDLRRVAGRLTYDADQDGTPERYGIYIPAHFVEALELMNGARIERGGLCATISDASAEVYRKYIALMDDRLMPDLRRMQALGMQPMQMLQAGRVAMLVEAVPHQGLFESLEVDFGIAPLPRFDGHSPSYFRSRSGGLSISSTTRHPREAWQALTWIVGGASIYQPNPVLADQDFVAGWEERYPRLLGSGFRSVWDLSLRHNGGDPRFFVRFSSWTAPAILERLQPYLDRLWARQIGVAELREALPEINRNVGRALRDALSQEKLRPPFRALIEHSLQEVAGGACN
jgi:ABC-type glycerol-3-phosphate transport system substrate-binding protein